MGPVHYSEPVPLSSLFSPSEKWDKIPHQVVVWFKREFRSSGRRIVGCLREILKY